MTTDQTAEQKTSRRRGAVWATMFLGAALLAIASFTSTGCPAWLSSAVLSCSRELVALVDAVLTQDDWRAALAEAAGRHGADAVACALREVRAAKPAPPLPGGAPQPGDLYMLDGPRRLIRVSLRDIKNDRAALWLRENGYEKILTAKPPAR